MTCSVTRSYTSRLLAVGYLKSWVYRSRPSNLSELNDAIRLDLSCIPPEILHSAVVGLMTHFQCVIPCGGGHVKHIML
ncbi:hypothetical protein NPIL_658351 [Nephila pilipes]|uniref:Uncharacterized protein n=1 Tax=Nephila pilipes TaxID=299642 RepID=A0A8X6P1G0_NEPPI|nr:hypothetical protein NPIL_658351 [Nephila pilipes]